jgi:hypothetical protein
MGIILLDFGVMGRELAQLRMCSGYICDKVAASLLCHQCLHLDMAALQSSSTSPATTLVGVTSALLFNIPSSVWLLLEMRDVLQSLGYLCFSSGW